MIAVYHVLIPRLVPKLGSEVVKIKGRDGKKSGKSQSELIKIVTSYYLHVNYVNIQISDSSVITSQNKVKLCTPTMQAKTELTM